MKVKQETILQKSHSSIFAQGQTNAYSVLISFMGTKSFVYTKKQLNKKGLILILDFTVDDYDSILITPYNANIETDQVSKF